MPSLTLKEAKARYVQFGACDHDKKFQYTMVPYKCMVELTCCGVCNKQISKVYLA